MLHVSARGSELIVTPEGPRAFAALLSSRDVDPDRADRLSKRIDEIVGAYVGGDFGPLHDAYEHRVSLEHLRTEWDNQRASLDEEYGPFRGYEILGTAFRDGRDVTVARHRFERGHSDTAFVWDPEEHEHLLGRSRRGLDPAVRFVPTGGGAFGSWDDGISASRTLRFTIETDGKKSLRLATAQGDLVATR